MRLNIVHPGAEELVYEIRSVVELANKLAAAGVPITWENIGDPVAKGEQVPDWIKQCIAEEILNNNNALGYSPTKGLLKTREYIAQTRSEETGNDLDAENVMFFNGLGDAITKVYTWLNPIARVLGPNPAYPTHSSIEGAHGRSHHMTYELDPDNNWLPDMEDVRNKVKYNPSISALLIINPDNPTGMIYPREILEEFVKIAREFKLFLIADEIYGNLAFDDSFVSLAALADDVPTMIMRGLSKEVPWPGSRCGWVEFYNTDKDPAFSRYAKSIEDAKMNEVCSTTLPQSVLPSVLGDDRYEQYLEERKKKYQSRADLAFEILNKSKLFSVVKPKGAFYLSVTFTDEFRANPPVLKPFNEAAAKLVSDEVDSDKDMAADKKFCLELLASTGICTVPLSSGFNSHVQGFRMTLLEEDEETFTKTLETIASI